MEFTHESLEAFEARFEEAEFLETERLPRQLISVRPDSRDIALLKRHARRKGIPQTNLLPYGFMNVSCRKKTGVYNGAALGVRVAS
jgi:hypothetical protein|tara:strand:+ start:291 stop:548 length:258 start_codon:yes stop_codon:yes gene_type:complete